MSTHQPHPSSQSPSTSKSSGASKPQFIRDIQEGDSVKTSFLVKHSAILVGKTGKPYLNLVFIDRTGEVEARAWDQVPEVANQAVKDAYVRVEGKCKLYQGRKQITVKKVQLLRDEEVNEADFKVDVGVDSESLYRKLVEYIESMEDVHYQALAKEILINDEDVVTRLKKAPAAKSLHHAYPGGLIEHIVSITGLLDGLSSHYGKQVNRDLLFLGGFFHDIAKLWELTYQKTTDYTDEGRLIGHLVMGVELMTEKIKHLNETHFKDDPFPKDKALFVKHVVLAHHGRLEYGSPKTPQLIEALIVHAIDDLDSKINAMRVFIEQDLNPGHWTNLNRQFERFFYKTPWVLENAISKSDYSS